ncbi:hypothetical protein JYT83_01400 [bacterium AH-315-F18]|nr:hypothetical protein [bacterium AH-315-F18]
MLVHRLRQSWHSVVSQAALLTLVVSFATNGTLLCLSEAHSSPLIRQVTSTVQAGFNPISYAGRGIGTTGRFLHRNVRFIAGTVSIGAGAVVGYSGAAISLIFTLEAMNSSGVVVPSLGFLGAGLGLVGIGLIVLGVWSIRKNFVSQRNGVTVDGLPRIGDLSKSM